MKRARKNAAAQQVEEPRFPDVLADSFPEQRAFCLDESKRVFILGTRRCAKSYSYGKRVIHEALSHPDRQWSLYTAENIRRWLTVAAHQFERGEIDEKRLEAIGKHCMKLLRAIQAKTEESGIREWMELHQGCLQGRCGTSRRAS